MLKSLIGSKKAGSLGIDIGAHSTKIVKLATLNGRTGVEFCGFLETSPTDPAYPDTLKNYLSANRLLHSEAASCLDDASLKIRKIELPKMPDADLKEAVKWKMRDVAEGPIEDYVVRFSSLSEPETVNSKKMTLVGYAVKKSAITGLSQLLMKAGLRPSLIEPAAVSLAAGIQSVYPSEDSWSAGIDLGLNKTIMVIIGKGKFYFSRLLSGIKMSNYTPDDSAFNQKLAAEIQNSLDTFAVAFHAEEIKKLFLAGGGASIQGLSDYLSTNLGVQSEILDPFTGLEVRPELKAAMDNKHHLFSQALALAKI